MNLLAMPSSGFRVQARIRSVFFGSRNLLLNSVGVEKPLLSIAFASFRASQFCRVVVVPKKNFT